MSLRAKLLTGIKDLKKGTTFTLDEADCFEPYPRKSVSRRLGELVDDGVIDRVTGGIFTVTTTKRERRTVK